MDIKAKALELVEKIKNDPALLKQFRENPVKVVETIIGMDLPDDQINQLADLSRPRSIWTRSAPCWAACSARSDPLHPRPEGRGCFLFCPFLKRHRIA